MKPLSKMMKIRMNMKNNKRIIAFAGRQRSGKSQLANLLVAEDDAQIITIAKYLKQLCCDILGIESIDKLNYLKNNKIRINATPSLQWADDISKLTGINYLNVAEELAKVDVVKDMRQMLQLVGTDIIRKYKPNWHVEQLKKEIKETKSQLIVIDDVRFPNEYEAINRLGGTTFFIIRTSGMSDTMISNHESETSLKWYDFTDNRIILNTETAEYMDDRFIRSYRDNFCDTDTNEIFVSANKKLFNNPLVIEDIKNRV